MKKTLLVSLATMLVLGLNAQEDQVLMTIDGEPVYLSEFEYIFSKNDVGAAVAADPASMQPASESAGAIADASKQAAEQSKRKKEYLELFTNFKLKVHEAEVLGYDTTESFRKEFEQYRSQATPKYMTDSAAIDSLIRMSYAHMALDRRAAHIVVACNKDASDSLREAQLAKINSIKAQANKDNFFELAKQYSEDPSIAQNGGELGWIVPFRYVYSFEEAVYNTPVGEVSEVFRSPFGYHIALVEEERAHKEVRASHIMKMVRGNDPQVDAQAKAIMDSIYDVLSGKDTQEAFAPMAREMSDDKGSAMNGGDLGYFGKGMMVKDFEDVAFELPVGAISKPFRSTYGWHIIYKEDERGIQPLDSLYKTISRNVQRDERFKEADKSFVRKTRAEYNLPAEMSDEEVKAYANQHLEEKYPEFKNLVREYHDGILLFDVSLEAVWDKAAQDVAGLQDCFNRHKKDYKWDAKRFKGYYIQAADKTSLQAAKMIVSNCMKREPDSIQSYIDQRINQDGKTLVKIKQGLWEKGRNKAIDVLAFKVKDTDYQPATDYPEAIVIGKMLSKPESYEDMRSTVTTQYQDELEKAWIEELKKKYPVEYKLTDF